MTQLQGYTSTFLSFVIHEHYGIEFQFVDLLDSTVSNVLGFYTTSIMTWSAGLKQRRLAKRQLSLVKARNQFNGQFARPFVDVRYSTPPPPTTN